MNSLKDKYKSSPAGTPDLSKLHDNDVASVLTALQQEKSRRQGAPVGAAQAPVEEPFHAGMPITPHGTVVTRHISQQAHMLEREAEQAHIARNVARGLQKSEGLAKKKEVHPGSEGDAKVYHAKGAEKEHIAKLTSSPAPADVDGAQKAFADQWQSHIPYTRKDADLKIFTGGESNAKIAKGLGTADGPDKGDYYAALLHTSPADLAGGETMCSAAGTCKLTCLNMAGRGGMALDPTDLNDIQVSRLGRTKLFKDHPDEFWALTHKDIREVINKAQAEGKKPAIRMNGTSDIAWEHIRPKELNGMNVFEAFPEVQFWDYTKRPERLKGNKHKNYNLTFSLDEKNQHMARRLLKDGHNVAGVFGGLTTKTKSRKGDNLPTTYGIGGDNFDVIDGDDTDFRFLDPKGGNGTPGKVVGLRAKGDAAFDFTGFTKFDHHAVNPKQMKRVMEKLGFDPRNPDSAKHAVQTLLEGLKTKASTTKNIAETDRVKGLVATRVGKFLHEARRKKRPVKDPGAAKPKKEKAEKSLQKSDHHCEYCDRLSKWKEHRLEKANPVSVSKSSADLLEKGNQVIDGTNYTYRVSHRPHFATNAPGIHVSISNGKEDYASHFYMKDSQMCEHCHTKREMVPAGTFEKLKRLGKSLATKHLSQAQKEDLGKAKDYMPQKKIQSMKIEGPTMPTVAVPKMPRVPDASIKIAAAEPVAKSQYAKTEDPELRGAKKKAVAQNEVKKDQINRQLKQEVIAHVSKKHGQRFEGQPATPKKTRGGIKDVPMGSPTNPPKD